MISSSPRAEGCNADAISHDRVVVEVEPGHGVGRPRLRGLFGQGDRLARAVQLDDSVTLGVLDGIRKHRRAPFTRRGAPEHVDQARAVEDVVAQRQRDAVVPDEGPDR